MTEPDEKDRRTPDPEENQWNTFMGDDMDYNQFDEEQYRRDYCEW